MSASCTLRRLPMRLSVSIVVAIAVIASVLRTLDLHYVTSYSMADTLLPGDLVVVVRNVPINVLPTDNGPTGRRPHRGEIWVYGSPSGVGATRVKRVIGLPGDTVAMVSGTMTVNGAALHASNVRPNRSTIAMASLSWHRQYLSPGVAEVDYHPTPTDWGPLLVPPNSYFLLGDNPVSSIDSRHEGFVGGNRMVGRVGWILFSYGLPDTALVAVDKGVRWARIGRTE